MAYKQRTDKINYHELETEVLKFWDEQQVFEKSITSRQGKPTFTFYEGPPTANGRPGIHHVMARTLKDIICRYRTMAGFQVYRKAGWDTHGLPVEIEVEKSLGFKHKDEIVTYGIEKFNEECKKSVWKYKTEWEEMTRMMGYWVDLSRPYVTFENQYMESIWWALKQYFDKGMIYKGYKIQPYCPRCETPLSSHEVSLGYQDVKDPSIYVKMKLKGSEKTYFLVWTTTPWTLLSNVALAVHPEVEYVKVEHKGQELILAEARLNVLGEDYKVIEKILGKDLIGLQYQPLFVTPLNEALLKPRAFAYKEFQRKLHIDGQDAQKVYLEIDATRKGVRYDSPLVLANDHAKTVVMPLPLYARIRHANLILKKILGSEASKQLMEETLSGATDSTASGPSAFFVVPADFVTIEDGSGIVHMAPAYGEDDYQVGLKYSLPTLHPVNKSGEFDATVPAYAGKFVKNADPEITADLKERGLLYKKEQYLHSYPHCWRCSSPLLYYARDSWYIRTTSYASRMIELNKQINWIPPEVGSGRFGNWLEENKDWALSRDRFWGTPLPIWICEKCGKQKCVGSVEELKKGSTVPDPLDLHKPHVDKVTFACDGCGGTMRRTPELIDVWFDSGSMPFAQWHYPFENKEVFDRSYPADFISEGIDQTRGWFYTLHAIGSFLFDKPAFRNVLVNELILDKQGQKMSKSKGNTVDPFQLLKKYGADTTRWYLVAQSPVWRPKLFDEDGLAEVQRKFFSTWLNTYSFFVLYANVDGFTYEQQSIPVAERPEIDRWILSALNSLIKTYRQSLDGYDVTRAARSISDFTIDQLSNWYVRRNRRRFWKSEKGKDKTAAYQTLFECLVAVAQLAAPFAPFLSDELFRSLAAGSQKESEPSVHLSYLPEADASVIDGALERKMEYAIKVVGLVRAMRMKSNLKTRQPLKRIIIPVLSNEHRDSIKQMEDVILEEINVKQIEFVSDESGIVKKKAKPNFKSLGKKFGRDVQAAASAIRDMTGDQIRNLQKEGTFLLASGGRQFELAAEDVEVQHEDIKGWLVESDGSLTVALDTELSDSLINEGLAREFVNRVQNLRKESGFEVTDRIRIYHRSSEKLAKALEQMIDYIKQETLAQEVARVTDREKQILTFNTSEINGEQSEIAVEKI
jgi:isoleucyl-tRNA synthetase